MPTHLSAFLVTTWLLAMLPGAGQALMVRQTLNGGLRTAWATIGGTCTGVVLWTGAAAAGLSAVLLTNPQAYTAMRVGGGVLLVGLGLNTLRSLRRTARSEATARPELDPGRRRAYAAGLATNLGNPKAGVFAVSLLPQFVTPAGPVFWSSLLLGVLWAAVTGAWYLLFTWAVSRGRDLIARPSVHRGLQVATGCGLLGLGVAVAVGV